MQCQEDLLLQGIREHIRYLRLFPGIYSFPLKEAAETLKVETENRKGSFYEVGAIPAHPGHSGLQRGEGRGQAAAVGAPHAPLLRAPSGQPVCQIRGLYQAAFLLRIYPGSQGSGRRLLAYADERNDPNGDAG